MTDPLGLIGRSGSAGAMKPIAPSNREAQGPDFRALFEKEIAKVNELQADAMRAAEDLASGRRDDLEGAIIATQKADMAFRMLLQVRNKVMEAYDEVKQVRV